MLCMVTVPALAQKETCFNSQGMGDIKASKEHFSGGWFLGSMVLGVAGGLIGMGVATALAAGSSPMPKMLPPETQVELTCYINGYQKGGRSKNVKAAVMGGVFGTVIFVTLYVSMADHPFEF